MLVLRSALTLTVVQLVAGRKLPRRHASILNANMLEGLRWKPLRHGESREFGNVVVQLSQGRMILEHKAEPGNIQSEWDTLRCRAPDYAGCIADKAILALQASGKQDLRLLMLGLGGGSIVGHIICASFTIDRSLRVTAVESDEDVTRAAQEVFFPAMYHNDSFLLSEQQVAALQHVRIIHADARHVVEGSVSLPVDATGPFDVIIEDFAYGAYGTLDVNFWKALREQHAHTNASLFVNTLYDDRKEITRLTQDLAAASWSDIVQTVDRGLQAEVGDAKIIAPEHWMQGDNMIISATNRICASLSGTVLRGGDQRLV